MCYGDKACPTPYRQRHTSVLTFVIARLYALEKSVLEIGVEPWITAFSGPSTAEIAATRLARFGHATFGTFVSYLVDDLIVGSW